MFKKLNLKQNNQNFFIYFRIRLSSVLDDQISQQVANRRKILWLQLNIIGNHVSTHFNIFLNRSLYIFFSNFI